MNSILEIIQQMELSNKEKRVFPASVLYKDLIRECIKQGHQVWIVNKELRKLKDSNQITTYRTINNTSLSCQKTDH